MVMQAIDIGPGTDPEALAEQIHALVIGPCIQISSRRMTPAQLALVYTSLISGIAGSMVADFGQPSASRALRSMAHHLDAIDFAPSTTH